MALIKITPRTRKPQGYYYKDGDRWEKFYIEYEDGIKWNLFCKSLSKPPSKEDFEKFMLETQINYTK